MCSMIELGLVKTMLVVQIFDITEGPNTLRSVEQLVSWKWVLNSS